MPELTRCVDVGKLGFCSTNSTLESRVLDLVSRLTLEEKQQLVVITGGGSQDKPGDGGVPRLGIPNCKCHIPSIDCAVVGRGLPSLSFRFCGSLSDNPLY